MSNGQPHSQAIVVIGGGTAGITAAVEVAETGYEVVLLEKGPALGGRVTRLNRYFPKLCHPTCGLEINYQRIKKDPRLKVITMAEVQGISGGRGNDTVAVKAAPRHVNAKCTACGACAEAAETEVANPFNYGMDEGQGADTANSISRRAKSRRHCFHGFLNVCLSRGGRVTQNDFVALRQTGPSPDPVCARVS